MKTHCVTLLKCFFRVLKTQVEGLGEREILQLFFSTFLERVFQSNNIRLRARVFYERIVNEVQPRVDSE